LPPSDLSDCRPSRLATYELTGGAISNGPYELVEAGRIGGGVQRFEVDTLLTH
jgi:hypothetical protein